MSSTSIAEPGKIQLLLGFQYCIAEQATFSTQFDYAKDFSQCKMQLSSSKANGLPQDSIEKGRNFKIITEIVQNNDEFTWSQIYPGGHTLTNTFVIGKESEMETVGGKKFKAIVRKENGKVTADFPNYHYTAEIAGDKLIEVSTVGDITFKRISKKLS
ncbi:gastrotropin isoform X2 [Pantherophis guttatus]|uniref:Gastrotropin isoform X2 n=1 Tax=Pantherophis guttatus TaxID=94885 RepID=A0A6P9AUP4_PANGU|nr:gastrotropin isoform X2 [Pantherophis guttatus]